MSRTRTGFSPRRLTLFWPGGSDERSNVIFSERAEVLLSWQSLILIARGNNISHLGTKAAFCRVCKSHAVLNLRGVAKNVRTLKRAECSVQRRLCYLVENCFDWITGMLRVESTVTSRGACPRDFEPRVVLPRKFEPYIFVCSQVTWALVLSSPDIFDQAVLI